MRTHLELCDQEKIKHWSEMPGMKCEFRSRTEKLFGVLCDLWNTEGVSKQSFQTYNSIGTTLLPPPPFSTLSQLRF